VANHQGDGERRQSPLHRLLWAIGWPPQQRARTGWTRFQKTADYNTIANRVPLAAMIRWPRL